MTIKPDLSRGAIIAILKRHEVIPNPDTGQGLVCMWCGDQPRGMDTATHQGTFLAPLVKEALAVEWDEGKASNDSNDLFSQESINPHRSSKK